VIEEVRLRYILGGIFITAGALRGYVLFRYKVFPTRLGLAMYGLFAGTVLMQLLWFVPIANAGGEEIYLTTIGDTIVSSGILAITGEALGILWAAGKAARVVWRVGIGLTVCILTIGLGVSLGWSSTAEMRLLFQSQSGETLYNYLALGDSIALLGLLMLGLLKNPLLRLAVLVISAVALFFAYSRTSFFLFLASSAFILFVNSRNSQRVGLAAVVTLVIFLGFGAAAESDALQPAIERMTILLFNREADESYLARKVLLSDGVQYLKENWLMGRFLDEWWREGVAGGYIHNWLSFWQSYGLVPFLGSLALFGASGLKLWKQLSNPADSTGTAVALWMYATLAIVTSRAYGWPFFWLAFGVVTILAYARPRVEGAAAQTIQR
jgi:hypothetical protein